MHSTRRLPLAFLLPSWSESQLALLRQAKPTAVSLPSAGLSCRQSTIRSSSQISGTPSDSHNAQPRKLPRRNERGQRIMLPSDEQGVRKQDRQKDVGQPMVARRGPAHSTQEKVHGLLSARQQLLRQRMLAPSTRRADRPTSESAGTNDSLIGEDIVYQRGQRRLRDGRAIAMPGAVEGNVGKNGDYVSIQSLRSHYLSAGNPKEYSIKPSTTPSLREALYGMSSKAVNGDLSETPADLVEVDQRTDNKLKNLNSPNAGSLSSRYSKSGTENASRKGHSKHDPDGKDDRAVLIYETFDLSLEKEDFMRAVPQSKHVDSTSVPCEPLDISAGHAEWSFERRKRYYLVFRNPEHALAFLRRNEIMHKATVAFSSEVLDILPAIHVGLAGLNKEEIEAIKDEYTLSTNDQRLNSWIAPDGERVEILRSLRRQLSNGFRALDGTVVLLSFDGASPTSDEIRHELDQDGANMGCTWSAVDRIRAAPRPKAVTSELNAYIAGDNESEAQGQLYSPPKNERASSRWILAFDDEIEARRFVRTWHMREWPLSQEQLGHAAKSSGYSQASLSARLLW